MNSRMTNGRASVAIIAFMAIALAAYGAWRLAPGSNPELGGSLKSGDSNADRTRSDRRGTGVGVSAWATGTAADRREAEGVRRRAQSSHG
jgi:hypothetical protein